MRALLINCTLRQGRQLDGRRDQHEDIHDEVAVTLDHFDSRWPSTCSLERLPPHVS